jgi:ubiquinol-cytochrome c reductase cytochrome b subunit
MTALAGGAMIRGLHHWGSSAMIIVVVLHMLQVFLWGAYKKPREATWIAGCLLLLLTMAFGLTGYLLPWDNRAYWGTVVTTQIAGLAPGAGPYVQRLLGADANGIGVITFARFYTAHIMLLPLVTLLLVGVHLILVRRHGVAPVPKDAALPKKKFYPGQVFKDTVAAFSYVMILALLANFAKVGLGAMADPTDTSYVPRPEWYFLFLFQLLKFFEGPLEVIGAVVLPTIGMIALFLVPFIDRSAAMRVQKRTFALATVAFCALGWAGLTQRAIATTPENLEDPEAGLKPPQMWREIPAEHLAGIGYFRQASCSQCHALGRSGAGPDLAKAASLRPMEWLDDHFMQSASNLTSAQIRSMAILVTKRTDKGLDAWVRAPDDAIAGAWVYQNRQCGACHLLNGSGGTIAPPMNGLFARRSKAWVTEHFTDPQKFVRNSSMPAFHFAPQELAVLTNYILAIPR